MPATSHVPYAEPDSSHQWRAELLTRFSWALCLGAAPLVIFTLATLQTATSTRAAFLLLLLASAASGLAHRLDFRARGLGLIVVLVSLGAVLARNSGPGPGMFLGFALAVVLAVVLFGARGGLLALLAGAVCLLVFGLSGRLETGAYWAQEIPQTRAWFRMTATYALFSVLLVVLVSSALRRMEENEERLRLALEAAHMGTWEWDITTGAVTRGGRTAALLGLPDKLVPGTFDEFTKALHPGDLPAVKEAISLALSGAGTLDAEFRVRTEPPRWLQSRGRVYRDSTGMAILMRGTVADITDRKRAEEALRDSEAELRALFASMEDVILVLDSEGRYLRIAPTNPSLLYRPPHELLGKTLHEVFPAERADAFLAEIRRCLAIRRTLRFEYELPIRDSVAWFAATVSPMTEDKVVWVARDDTEHRRAETALRESEDRWRHISEATFEGIGFSQDGVLTDANAQLAEMLGYVLPELVGRPVTDLVAPEDRAKVTNAIRSAQTRGYEHLALRKDGSTLLVETRARSLTRRGQILRVTAVRDVSERHRLEAELRRRETLAAMGSLVAGVAHEVRTPLFSLSATLDALEAGAGTPDQQHELKDLLRSQVRRLANLMQDLLDYGRPPRLKLARAGIREPVQRAVRSCGALASRSAVGLALDVPEGLPQVDADLGRLEQVFENLLANALQHAPRGSTVRVTARPTTAPPAGLTCAVEDDGPGLLPSDVERVFEPFFSRRPGGTGMGLAIAHRLVEAHGGALTAGNRAGTGAVFTVFLPAAGESRAGGAVA
jgi:PAS domain S-box-containing protein